jgi:hypothetical protein
MVLLVAACSTKEPAGPRFYCDATGSCSLVCAKEPCTERAYATCAWLMSGRSFLCYSDPADCTDAQSRTKLGPCERKTAEELLPR